MKKIIFKNFFTIVLSLIILIYIGYQIYNINKKSVSTEPAVYSTINDSIDVEAYIIREETIIYNDRQGVVNYVVDNGDKVSSNGKIANLYKSSNDVIIEKEIQQIDEEINQLKNLDGVSNAAISNPNIINKQVSDCLKGSIEDINDNKFQKLNKNKNNILYLINHRNVLTGKGCNFNNRMTELNDKKNSLLSSYNKEIESILSPKSGYFVSVVDEVEKINDYSNATSLMPADITEALKKKEVQTQDNNVFGKIISGVNWYVSCNVPYADAVNIKLDQNLNITFPFSSMSDIPCRVVGVNPDGKKSETAIILQCDYMSKELALVRSEYIKLNISSYSGILINKKSLHEDTVIKETINENGETVKEEKKVQGVYILYGNEMVFRQIVPLFANNNHIVCKDKPTEEELWGGESIKQYDEIITEGSGLYGGKIVK